MTDLYSLNGAVPAALPRIIRVPEGSRMRNLSGASITPAAITPTSPRNSATWMPSSTTARRTILTSSRRRSSGWRSVLSSPPVRSRSSAR